MPPRISTEITQKITARLNEIGDSITGMYRSISETAFSKDELNNILETAKKYLMELEGAKDQLDALQNETLSQRRDAEQERAEQAILFIEERVNEKPLQGLSELFDSK